jgi:hypothetical protein
MSSSKIGRHFSQKMLVMRHHLPNKLLFYKANNIKPVLHFLTNTNYGYELARVQQQRFLQDYPNETHIVNVFEKRTAARDLSKTVHIAQKNGCRIAFDVMRVENNQPFDALLNRTIMEGNHYMAYKSYQMWITNTLHKIEKDLRFFASIGVPLNVRISDEPYFVNNSSSVPKSIIDMNYLKATELLLAHKKYLGDLVFSTHDPYLFDRIKDIDSKGVYHSSYIGQDAVFSNKGSISKMVVIPFGHLQRSAHHFVTSTDYKDSRLLGHVV